MCTGRDDPLGLVDVEWVHPLDWPFYWHEWFWMWDPSYHHWFVRLLGIGLSIRRRR